MRILNVTQSYYPFQDRGGPAFKVRSISRGLVKRGHKVTVLTADLGLETEQATSIGAVHVDRGWRSSLDGVEAIYLNTRGHYRSLTLNPGVVAFCRRRLGQFDLVHIYGLYDLLGPAVARYCRALGIPYFIEPLGMTRPIDRGFALKKLWRRLVSSYLERASRLIATSELEKEELLECGFPPHTVLLRFNGIDGDDFSVLPRAGGFRREHGISVEERLVLFLGRLIPRKGADLLIEALAQIDSGLSASQNTLVIAGPEGETGYLAFLHNKARALGVGDRVRFLRPLYAEDKKSAMIDADVFVLPSRYENFGNSAAEAIACGTPAIVSDRCGIAPLIHQRAGLVTQYDSVAIARTLNQLFGDRALYERLKCGCASVAAEIAWDKLVEDMEVSYQDAVRAPSPRAAVLVA
jgi:glycosyltransferase involved in cell wall biosynthesis